MSIGTFHYPQPANEPVLNYAPGSPERAALKRTIAALKKQVIDVPMYIGGKAVRTGKKVSMHPPHARAHVRMTCVTRVHARSAQSPVAGKFFRGREKGKNSPLKYTIILTNIPHKNIEQRISNAAISAAAGISAIAYYRFSILN
jgi:hypothetical protein